MEGVKFEVQGCVNSLKCTAVRSNWLILAIEVLPKKGLRCRCKIVSLKSAPYTIQRPVS